MKRKAFFSIFIIIMSMILTSCSQKEEYGKYDVEFFDVFDTITKIVVYEKSEKLANEELYKMREEFSELNKLFDKYHTYEGMNNLKTINDNAGIQPVKVDDRLFHLIKTSVDYYYTLSDKTDIAIGPAVDLWNEYRNLYSDGDTKEQVKAKMGSYIPTEEELNALRPFMNIKDVVINDSDKSIYLSKKGMQLDVGSVAKGYATELVAENAEKNGVKSAVISAGGNVRVIGHPLDGRDNFEVAIENPYKNNDEGANFLTVLKVNNSSVVTSGDYQRFFTVDNKRYCHIIDPTTLMPTRNFRSVSVITKDSFLCDYLSTSLFLMSYEDGLKLCNKLGVDAIWAFSNGEVKYTKGAEKMVIKQ